MLQLEINHVIQQPNEANKNTCRPPLPQQKRFARCGTTQLEVEVCLQVKNDELLLLLVPVQSARVHKFLSSVSGRLIEIKKVRENAREHFRYIASYLVHNFSHESTMCDIFNKFLSFVSGEYARAPITFLVKVQCVVTYKVGHDILPKFLCSVSGQIEKVRENARCK